MQTKSAQSIETEMLDVGARLKAFRSAKGHSLAKLSEMTGISDATLSRVENGRTLVSAHNLYTLSKVLEVDITAFFDANATPLRSAIRSVTRKGEGQQISTENFVTTVFGADLANKKMHPALNIIDKQTLDEIDGLTAHPGEEFLYVLHGRLILHSQHYAPLYLEAGDSIYFDGSMPHAYLSAAQTPAEILVITSIDAIQIEGK